ncbi:MAG: DUF748 domain-containing protein [Verrucomicrobiota bacterium]
MNPVTVCRDAVCRQLKRTRTYWQRLSHAGRLVVLGLVLLLIAARLAAPLVLQRYVNRTLDRHPEYGGQIGQVHIHLLRGAYSIEHVEIVKKTGQVPVPFLSARTVDFSVHWRELFHGSVVAQIQVDRAQLNFVKGRTKEDSQTEIQKSWTALLQDLYPFQINRCEIRDSQVWYHDFYSNPQVHVYLTNMLLVATNLSNVRDTRQELPAAINVRGITIGHGHLDASLRLNPLASKPTFDFKAAVTNMNLPALNGFLRAYAKADVRAGRLDVFAEAAGVHGRFEGYLKPLATDLKVFNTEEKNPIQVVWEAIVALVAQTFKNHPNDRFGTKIPFAGTFDDPQVDAWETILNVLRNTFVQALQPRIEDSESPRKLRRREP